MRYGKSDLTNACCEGDAKLVKKLLATTPKPKLDGSDGEKYMEKDDQRKGRPFYTPLGEAARIGHVAVLDLLLAAGAPIECLDYNGKTPFMLACDGAKLETSRRLLEAGANRFHEDFDGWDSLAHALRDGDCTPALIRFLLEAGLDPTVKRGSDKLDAVGRLGFDPITLKAKDRSARQRAGERLEILKVLRELWKGSTKRLDTLLAKSGVSIAEKTKADTKQATAFAALAKPGRQRKAAILKAIGKDAAERHEELEALATQVLARPDVIADAAWPEFVRTLVQLTPSWSGLMKAQFGVDMSIDDEGDDESGTMELIGDEKLSTIELALGLLAAPAAIARADWATLVTFVADEKKARLGPYSYGDAEIAAVFKAAGVKARPLRAAAKKAWPYAKL